MTGSDWQGGVYPTDSISAGLRWGEPHPATRQCKNIGLCACLDVLQPEDEADTDVPTAVVAGEIATDVGVQGHPLAA